jgi:serine/threonine protein kinase
VPQRLKARGTFKDLQLQCTHLALTISSLSYVQNLLLDTEGNLKISDFGFSTLNIGDADGDGGARAELLHTTCGTPNYVAPEVLGKDGYDGKRGTFWDSGSRIAWYCSVSRLVGLVASLPVEVCITTLIARVVRGLLCSR